VTIRLRAGLPSFRRKDVFACLRAAVRRARERGFAVAHFAILSNHAHLIIEPVAGPAVRSLGRPMRSLCVSFARRLNSALDREGAVFHGRYHLHVLRTPTEVRRAIDYVLTNEARHGARRAGIFGRQMYRVRLDPFSSALAFRDWRNLVGARAEFEATGWAEQEILNWFDEILVPARTWLLREGWGRGSEA